MTIRTVALTGGACSGKTSVFSQLQEHELISGLKFVPEAATMLLSSGYPTRPEDPELWTPWTTEFQRALLNLQLSLEDWARQQYRDCDKAVIIFDRGLVDSAAYHPEGLAGVSAITGLTPSALYGRYDLVLHLESLATASPELYSHGNNEHRLEALDEAIERELATREAWKDHPSRIMISGPDLGYKQARVAEHLYHLIYHQMS